MRDIFEYRWPHSQPNFRKLALKNYNEIILLNNGPLEELFYGYANKFKKSARIIVENLIQRQRISELDCYFFSLAFLYRHSLELILKSIALKHIPNTEDQKKFLNDTFHNLSLLFSAITPYIKVRNAEEYSWLKEYFESFNHMDKESDSFRYPFSIKFKKEFDNAKIYYIEEFIDKQTHIDLVSFVNKMELAFSILNRYYEGSSVIDTSYKRYRPTLLEEGGNYWLQSVIGYSYFRQKFYPYIRAYIESAELLFKIAREQNDLDQTIFLPMCYLYRNGLELSMKEILFEECEYDFQTAARLLKESSHSLKKLWRHIKEDIIRHSSAPDDDNTLENVEKYLEQIHDFDGASDKFRYPTDKYLNLYFKNPVKLDIKNIYEFFTESNNFFSGASSMMSVQNEQLAEMEAEYKAEMEAEYRSEMRSYYSDY